MSNDSEFDRLRALHLRSASAMREMSDYAQYVESQIVFEQGFDIVRTIDSKTVSARYALVSHSSANVHVEIDMTEHANSVTVIASLAYYTQENSYKQQHKDTVNMMSADRNRDSVLSAVQRAIADARDNCAVSNAVALR